MAASGDKVGSSKDQSEENQKHICFLPGEPSMNHLQGVAQKWSMWLNSLVLCPVAEEFWGEDVSVTKVAWDIQNMNNRKRTSSLKT